MMVTVRISKVAKSHNAWLLTRIVLYIGNPLCS
jgi:hypothetical protein